MRLSPPGGRRSAALAASLLLFAVAGCGSRLAQVKGTITLADGRPMTRGMVIFEKGEGEAAVMARGAIAPDGTYEMSTYKPGDGVPPGKYRVQINPIDLSDTPDEQKNLPFDAKYTKFDTSGLMYEVKPGPNLFDIKLSEAPPAEGKAEEAKPKDEKAGEPKSKEEPKPKGSE